MTNAATTLYERICNLPEPHSRADLADHLPDDVRPLDLAALLDDDDPNEPAELRYLLVLASVTITRLCGALSDIATRAAVAHAQRAPSDDAIIADHIMDILKIAGDAHAGRAS